MRKLRQRGAVAYPNKEIKTRRPDAVVYSYNSNTLTGPGGRIT